VTILVLKIQPARNFPEDSSFEPLLNFGRFISLDLGRKFYRADIRLYFLLEVFHNVATLRSECISTEMRKVGPLLRISDSLSGTGYGKDGCHLISLKLEDEKDITKNQRSVLPLKSVRDAEM
jgi:hypothetical protein